MENQNVGIGSSALASATLTSNNVAIGAAYFPQTGDNDSGMNIAVGVILLLKILKMVMLMSQSENGYAGS